MEFLSKGELLLLHLRRRLSIRSLRGREAIRAAVTSRAASASRRCPWGPPAAGPSRC